jgi:hypothetical protein
MQMFTLELRKLHAGWRVAGVALCAALLIGGCGGGGADAGGGVDTGGTGSAPTYSSGPITGFGSIVVNGVRFDDSAARVQDDDGADRSRSDLKLGTVVEIEAGPISTDAATGVRTSTASKAQIGSEIKGPVEAVDVAGGTLTVIGQLVRVDADTVFDGFAQGLASVRVGQRVEVNALFDATNDRHTATRVELKAGLDEFKLRGRITRLNTSAKTFSIGSATISFARVPARELPALSDGLVARVTVLTVPQGGVWTATKVRTAAATPPIADRVEAELEGYVSDFVSLASFRINGTPVDASGAGVEFEDGSSDQVANGARLEVEGELRGGVLVARKVEIERVADPDKFELSGAIESVNAVARSFVLRGMTVMHDSGTSFDDGSSADLVVGARVEVKGRLSANGTQLLASQIEFDG